MPSDLGQFLKGEEYDSPGLDPSQGLAGESDLARVLQGDMSSALDPGDVLAVGGNTSSAGFLTSFWSALAPEFIGREPSSAVQAYRRRHSGRGTASHLAGSILPFAIPIFWKGALGLKLAARLPGLARAVTWAEAAHHPVRAAAVKEAARFAPLELARIGGSAVAGDPREGVAERAWSTTKHAALDLSLFAGFGGAVGLLRHARPFPRDLVEGEALVQEAIPGYNLRWSPQQKLRTLLALKTGGDKEVLTRLAGVPDTVAAGLAKTIRKQEPHHRIAYVKSIAFGAMDEVSGKAAATALSRRFALGVTPGSRTSLFRVGKGGVKDRATLEALEELAELPNDWEAFAMFPRFVELLTDNAAKGFRNTILRNMQRVDSKWYVAQQDNGLYVLAKKIRGRSLPPKEGAAGLAEAKVGRAGDKFVLLQTDNPGVFMPHAERFAESLNLNAYKMADKFAYDAMKAQVPVLKQMDDIKRMMQSAELVGTEPGKRAVQLMSKLSPTQEALFAESRGLGRFFTKRMKEFVAPAMFQFSDSPRAQMIYQAMRTMFNSSMARTSVEFFGSEGAPKSRTLVGQVFEVRERIGGIDRLISKLTKEGLADVNEAVVGNLPIREARALKMDATAIRLLEKLDQVDKKKVRELKSLFQHVEEPGFEPLQAHYMVSRSWTGAHRVKIMNESGKVVAMGSGRSSKTAKQNAEAIIKSALEDDGVKLHADLTKTEVWGRDRDLKESFDMVFNTDASKAANKARVKLLKTREPGRFEEEGRKGILGFREDLNKKELKEMVYNHLLESNRYMAGRAVGLGMADDMARLRGEFPKLHKQLDDRFHRMMGEAGEFDRAVTRAVDSVLAPFVGPNSASRIVRVTNRGLFTLTLGMGDLGFVALNALTPIQTAMPEVAFLLSAPPARLAKYYSSFLVMGPERVHVVNHITPMKLMAQAMRDMGKPGDELRAAFTKAQDDMIISPRFIEAFVGETSEAVSGFKEVLKGNQNISNYILSLSEFLPGKSEEFSRGFAFTLGHNVGRDFFGLKGKALYKFASEFTGRTMYNYGTGDRAKVITGSIGTLFGLFKNWSMHYMANFMVYSGEGFLRGNWKPLLWQNAGTFGLAGVGAVPGYGMANSVSKALSDETLMEHMYQLFGYAEPAAGEFVTDRGSDAFFYGLPALFGVTLQGRAAPPGAELIRDVNMFFSMAVVDRMTHFSRTIGAAVDHAKNTGRHPLDSRKITDEFARAVAPRTLYRFIQTSADRGVRSLSTGNMLISPISIPERVFFTFGATPTEIDKAFVINDELFQDQAAARERIASYGSAIAEARFRKDYRGAMRMLLDAMLEGLPVDSVEKSADARESKMDEPLMERQFEDLQVRALSRTLRVGR
jgi:hypothetical protein